MTIIILNLCYNFLYGFAANINNKLGFELGFILLENSLLAPGSSLSSSSSPSFDLILGLTPALGHVLLLQNDLFYQFMITYMKNQQIFTPTSLKKS